MTIKHWPKALGAMGDPVGCLPALMDCLQSDKRCAEIEAKWLARVTAEIEVK